MVRDAAGARGLAEDDHLRGVALEGTDVALHPLQREPLVLDAGFGRIVVSAASVEASNFSAANLV